MRNNIEENLLNTFKEWYKKTYPNSYIEIGPGTQSKMADCEFEYKNEYIKLEAKIFIIGSNGDNRSDNFHKMFAQILTSRKKIPSNNINNFEIKYGFLFEKNTIEYVKNKIKKDCIIRDLIIFGACFELEYVFIYDDINESVKVDTWNEFIK